MEELKCAGLQTNRLDLTAATFDHIRAETESSERLAQLLETRVEPGWPPGEYDRDAQDFFGAGRYNLINDRDFMQIAARYSF